MDHHIHRDKIMRPKGGKGRYKAKRVHKPTAQAASSPNPSRGVPSTVDHEEEMMPVMFNFWIGNPIWYHDPAAGIKQPTLYRAQVDVPKSYCTVRTEAEPGPSNYIRAILDDNEDNLLATAFWRCVICNYTATTFTYSLFPVLNPSCDCPFEPDEPFEPSVQIFAAPFCELRNGSNCLQRATQLLKNQTQHVFPNFDAVHMRCANCEGPTRYDPPKDKKCPGCKQIAYCGIKCQSIDWPYHKEYCKAVQAEKHQEGFEEAKMWRERLFGTSDRPMQNPGFFHPPH